MENGVLIWTCTEYGCFVWKIIRYVTMMKSLLRLAVKRVSLGLGLLSCSCLLSSCSSCASMLEYLLSVPVNLVNYVLTSALP